MIEVRRTISNGPCDSCGTTAGPRAVVRFILTNKKSEMGYALPDLILCRDCLGNLGESIMAGFPTENAEMRYRNLRQNCREEFGIIQEMVRDGESAEVLVRAIQSRIDTLAGSDGTGSGENWLGAFRFEKPRIAPTPNAQVDGGEAGQRPCNRGKASGDRLDVPGANKSVPALATVLLEQVVSGVQERLDADILALREQAEKAPNEEVETWALLFRSGNILIYGADDPPPVAASAHGETLVRVAYRIISDEPNGVRTVADKRSMPPSADEAVANLTRKDL